MPESFGKWFACGGCHVFPLTLADKLKYSVKQWAPIEARSSTTLSKASTLEAHAEAAQQQVRRCIEVLVEGARVYNQQLRWSLRDLRADSVDEGLRICEEFLQMAKVASQAFGWRTYMAPGGEMRLREHSWKHIHESDLKTVADDIERGLRPFDDLPTDLLGSSDEERFDLFRRAARCDPGAVARLHHLFPLRSDLEDIADFLFRDLEREEIRRIIASIPSVRELAGQYATTLVSCPGSKKAEQAQRDLDILTSKSAAKGSVGRGRTRISFSEGTVVEVHRMSYALFRQVKEVDRFLEELGGVHWNDEERNRRLGKLYPSLVRLLKSDEIIPPRRGYRSITPYKIAGAVLGVSPSKVAKVVYG